MKIQKGITGIKWSIIVLFVFTAWKVNGQDGGMPARSFIRANQQEYMYALSEATKFFMFGNYTQAANLYQECLRINPESSASHYQLAKIFLQANELEKAKEHARKATRLSPGNTWYLYELASIYQVSQDLDSAISVYNELISKDPENLGLIYMTASLYERTKQFPEALEYLNLIDSKVGMTKETAVSKFRIYDQMGKDQLAMEQLKSASSFGEDDYAIAGMIAEYYRNHQVVDSAQHYYNKIYPAHKDDPAVVFSYAEFLLEQKLDVQAAGVMVDAMRNEEIDNMAKTGYLFKVIQDEKLYFLCKPVLDTTVNEYYKRYQNDIRAMSVYTDIKFRLGKYRDAAMVLKEIIALDDMNYPAMEQLVFCENAQGNTDSVLYYAGMAAERFPLKAIPYLFLGSAYYQDKNYEAAILKLEKGLALNSSGDLDIEFYSLLAECYDKKSDFKKSDEFFAKALQQDPDNLGINNNYAYYLSLREVNLREAKKMSLLTVKAEPNNSTYLDTYAWILFKMKKLSKAKRYIEAAVAHGGQTNGEILQHYGDILFALKYYKEAIQMWESALKYSEAEVAEGLRMKIKKAGSNLAR